MLFLEQKDHEEVVLGFLEKLLFLLRSYLNYY